VLSDICAFGGVGGFLLQVKQVVEGVVAGVREGEHSIDLLYAAGHAVVLVILVDGEDVGAGGRFDVLSLRSSENQLDAKLYMRRGGRSSRLILTRSD
jgi:hypothetical protein